jgi:short-subunit dehydrogenase
MPSLGVVITGASSGLGLHTLGQLLRRGHRVVAGVRGGEVRLNELLGNLASEAKGRIFAIDLHLDKPETFALARRAVDEHLGGQLDVLVNNAGYGLFGAIEDQSEAQIRKQFEVNTFGPIGLAQALIPQIRAARGRIINVSSAAGFWTMPLYGSYCASKHALEALTEGLYYDLRPSGVQVGLLEPGGFRTNFIGTSKVMAEGQSAAKRSEALVKFLAKSEAHLLAPEKVAGKLVRMCERRRLPLRTLAGIDAHLVNILSRILPDGLRAWLQDFLIRKLVFKD